MENFKDLYQILGVLETASLEEIKNSYRRLAKKYHPDAHPSDVSCETRFREISEAYSILSDPQKRKAYDEKRLNGRRQQSASSAQNPFAQGNPFDWFAQAHPFAQKASGKGGSSAGRRSPFGQRGTTDNPLDTTALFEQFMGIKR